MGLESGTYIDDLVTTNPAGTDTQNQGDDHLRLIKTILKNSFSDVDTAVGTIHQGVTAPASPVTNATIWWDTTNSVFKYYNGSSWIRIAANITEGQNSAFMWGGTGGGTVDVITATVSPAITAYAAGQSFAFVAAGANTGAVTINFNSVGAKAITKNGTTALAAGDLVSGRVYGITYDGTRFQLDDEPLKSIVNADIDAAAAIDTTKLGSGAVLQVVNATYSAVATGTTIMSMDDVIPTNTEGDQFMSLAITPKVPTSTLIVWAWAVAASDASSTFLTMALYQDSSAGLAANTYVTSAANEMGLLQLGYSVVSGGTSAITYKIRIGSSVAGNLTFNGNSNARVHGAIPKSGIIIMEVAA